MMLTGLPPIGSYSARCPHCGGKLAKFPARKIDCPSCGQPIHKRTRVGTKEPILVRPDQLSAVQRQYALLEVLRATGGEDDPEFVQVRRRLSERFGQLASVRDVLWGLWNERQIDLAVSGQWGLHRNAWYYLALLAEARGDLRQARGFYFYICYLDLNGPVNLAYGNQPPFDPRQGSLAGGIVGRLGALAARAREALRSQ